MNKERITLLYLGNMMQGVGLNQTTVDTLGDKFESFVQVVRGSHYGNMILRILHMWYLVIKWHRRADALLIDTYSTAAFHYAWSSAMLARFLGFPYITFLHGGYFPKRMDKSPYLSKQLILNSYKIISPSSFLKHEVEERFAVEVDVIPNSLDYNLYSFVLREELEPLNILWVRSFHKTYDPDLAVEIINELHKRGYSQTELTMVGPDKDGSLPKTKEYALSLGISNFIQFTGRLAKEEWINLAKKFNLFLSTTTADNTPVSVMEAMALGLPVVTSKVGGISFLFEDQQEGIMVEDRSVKGFCDAIEELIENPEKVRMLSENGRIKSNEWDWKTIELKWKSLFLNLPN